MAKAEFYLGRFRAVKSLVRQGTLVSTTTSELRFGTAFQLVQDRFGTRMYKFSN